MPSRLKRTYAPKNIILPELYPQWIGLSDERYITRLFLMKLFIWPLFIHNAIIDYSLNNFLLWILLVSLSFFFHYYHQRRTVASITLRFSSCWNRGGLCYTIRDAASILVRRATPLCAQPTSRRKEYKGYWVSTVLYTAVIHSVIVCIYVCARVHVCVCIFRICRLLFHW